MSTAIHNANPLPTLPTQEDMERWLREKMPGLTIFSPHTEWIQPEVHGRTDIWIPPDLGGQIRAHPATGKDTVCDGTLKIRGRFPNQKDSSGKKIEGQDAQAVIRYLMFQYREMGLIWIPGEDVEIDEQIKEASRETYRKHMRARDLETVGKRQEFKANWMKNPAKKGQPVPPPTELEMAAMDRLQKQQVEARSFKYNCDVETCPGYATNEWHRFFSHMTQSHQIEPDRRKYDGAVGATSGVPVESDDMDNDLARIAAKAEKERPGPKRGRAKKTTGRGRR